MTASSSEVARVVPGQAAIGLLLAALIVAGFLLLHIGAVYGLDLAEVPTLVVPVLVAVQTWLCVGLFIVAHDAMHGSLAPFRPGINRLVGRITLFLYAGFAYDRLLPKHFDHHRHAGTADDPDFDADHPAAFWPWFLRFFREYFGWRELLILACYGTAAVLLLGAPLANLVLFWAVPALLAALQLFCFGTWRPHRHGPAFADDHRARSDAFPPWLSLLTCYHFGYHHEHHMAPYLPWWRLPELYHGRKAVAEAQR